MGELAVLPLTADVSKAESIISREFHQTGKPVCVPGLTKKTGLSAYRLRKTFKQMGWMGRRKYGFAPASFWKEFDEKQPEALVETKLEEALVHVPEEQDALCLMDVTLEAYYRDVRNMWDTLRHACSDSNLEHLHEDIKSFKEATRQHICEVMKKL